MEAPLSQLAAMLDERFDYTARGQTKDRRITPCATTYSDPCDRRCRQRSPRPH